MSTSVFAFDDVHLSGDIAMYPPASRSARHAALQILAIAPAIAAVCALLGTPITALAGASTCRF
jgi:hypothetical protein